MVGRSESRGLEGWVLLFGVLAGCAADGGPSLPRHAPDEGAPDSGSGAGAGAGGGPGAPDDGHTSSASGDALGADGGWAGDGPPPLLGSSRGGHTWHTFCEGKADDAELPTDPRTLVQPGVNAHAAVHFNAYYVDCHVDAPAEDAAATTCGEYRARLGRATEMMEGGGMWFFGGNYPDSTLTSSADQYNTMWFRWGFPSRPANYDQVVAARWGLPLGEKRNPYPLPGEDPNATNGGSGQLPVGLTQLRDADGRYVSKIGPNCNWCHSGKVGDASDGEGLGALYGNGNSLVEIGAMFGDMIPGFPIAANKVRGTGDILLYPAIAALDIDKAGHYNGSLIAAPSGGSVDFPPWWNVGHRTRKFHDGSFAVDNTRPVMAFAMPILSASHMMDIPGARDWVEQHDQDAKLWVEAQKAPVYPGPVDEDLAEQGAILFHTKNLWGMDGTPGPHGGNGSCASCHGAYAPRYVHDTDFLDRPELEGIAAYVVPMDVIGTDPARFNSLNEGLKENLKWTWWAYGDNFTEGKCFGTVADGGYLAPPLYGIWASAPYFHNGAVPNVWEVLDPASRRPLWRRVSEPAVGAQQGQFTGFDTNLERAYDHEKLGWKYEVMGCGLPGSALDCADAAPEFTPAGTLWFTWNLDQPPATWQQIEDRKIYNTHKYSQGNQGHDFTDVLTDAERQALIEYLKTL